MQTRAGIPPLLLPSCVAYGKLLNFSELQFLLSVKYDDSYLLDLLQ